MLLYYLLIAIFIFHTTVLCWCIQILAVFACACIIYIHLTVYGIDIVHMSILHVEVCVNMIHVHVQDVVSINIRPITLQVVHIRYMPVD